MSGHRTSLPSRPPASRRRCASGTCSNEIRSATRGWMARVANSSKSRSRSSRNQAGCCARIKLIVFALVVDRRSTQFARQLSVYVAHSPPKLKACHLAEHEQRLTDCAGGSLHEYALTSLHSSRAVKELPCGRPTQNQCRRFGSVDARRHSGQVASPQRAIGSVRSEHRQIGHSFAEPKVAHAVTELIDFSDDIITHHKWWPAAHRLCVEVAPDHNIGVLQARGEHADPNLAPPSGRQGSLDHLQLLGTAIAPDFNNAVARLSQSSILLRVTYRRQNAPLLYSVSRHAVSSAIVSLFFIAWNGGGVIEEDQCASGSHKGRPSPIRICVIDINVGLAQSGHSSLLVLATASDHTGPKPERNPAAQRAVT